MLSVPVSPADPLSLSPPALFLFSVWVSLPPLPPAGIHTCLMGLTRYCVRRRRTTEMGKRVEDEAMEEIEGGVRGGKKRGKAKREERGSL